ncbi:MAG: hypothetical protein ABW148_00445 [Sedimenticola sp.]
MLKDNESVLFKELSSDAKIRDLESSEITSVFRTVFKESSKEYLAIDEVFASSEKHLTKGSKGRRP